MSGENYSILYDEFYKQTVILQFNSFCHVVTYVNR